MTPDLNRRRFLQMSSTAALAGAAGCGPETPPPAEAAGAVIGQPEGERAGMAMLDAGGNAVDAIVTAALTAGVVAVPSCGIAGYGGHMTLAFAGSGKVTSIDFNSTAPAAVREDSFTPDAEGNVPGRKNQFGWLAAGVPGTLAGMDLALERYGSRSFSETLRPAIEYARNGFEVDAGLARSIANAAEQFRQDPASEQLFFRNGEPLSAGDIYRNPGLAAVLEELAGQNSAEDFYRGEIARKIADAFQKNGGLLTYDDLAAYEAREVEPLRLEWLQDTLYTAPLTAGGATIFETLNILRALEWQTIGDLPRRAHARLEAMRIAWDDRLRLFGDPEYVDVPIDRLLSPEHGEEKAAEVRGAIDQGRMLEIEGDWFGQVGTIHLSAADRHGNMAALTLTHGGGFGARVTVPDLGLILGHGVSRFDPRPGKANSPAPGKRPLHNMCPTVVFRGGRPVLAVGARGGRRIPNAVLGILLNFCALGRSAEESVNAGRLHTEGGARVEFDVGWRADVTEYLAQTGYEAAPGRVAIASAVARSPEGAWTSLQR